MAYRRLKLPHLHPIGATFSILMLVQDAVPKDLLRQLKLARTNELMQIRNKKLPGWKRSIVKAQAFYDKELDRLLRLHANQDHPFRDPECAQILVDRLKKYDGQYYDLYSYSVMSNHAHAELDFSVQLPRNWQPGTPIPNYINLAKVMNLIKGGSSYLVNKHKNSQGQPLWGVRYRDRFIRSEEHLTFARRYTLNNTVKAGLFRTWQDHPFSGGMTEAAVAERRFRRIYPDARHWIDRLADFDRAHPNQGKGKLTWNR